MAADLNTVTLVGRLTRDPELRSTAGGQSVCEIRLAFNVSKKTPAGWQDEGQFVNVTIWGNQGETVAQYMQKGSKIGVSGRLVHRTWTDTNTGANREQHSVTAERVQFLDSKPTGDSAPAAAAPAAAPAPAPADDDIPF